MKDTGNNTQTAELVDKEGRISVLAIDEIDPITKEFRGKFITYLQLETGERFVLEPFSETYFVPLQPNAKVKVFVTL